MYFNTLIIMNEDTSGYGRRSRQPSGYCKLSMPNRVICYVQGLQQLPKGQAYRVYLMSEHKQKSVEIGMFQVGMSGNKEFRCTITPGDINNSGLTAQEIDGALIKVDGEGVKDLTVPLVGFVAGPYLWKSIIKGDSISLEQKEPVVELGLEEKNVVKEKPILEEKVVVKEKPILEEKVVVKEKPILEEKVVVKEKPILEEEVVVKEKPIPEVQVVADNKLVLEEEPELGLKPLPEWKAQPTIEVAVRGEEIATIDEIAPLKEEIERLNKIIGQSNRIIEDLKKELAREVPQAEPPQPDIPPKMAEPNKDRTVKENLEAFIRRFKEDNKKEDDKGNDIRENINNIFQKRIPMNPFPDSNDGIKWVRITHEDLLTFSQLPPEWSNQPFILEGNKQYKHFILGKDKDGLTYYVGIPGIFNPEKHDILDRDRIERFRCRYDVPLKAGEVGYWIVLI